MAKISVQLPKIVKQDAIRIGVGLGISTALCLLMIKIMDDFYDMGIGISPDGIFWVSIAIASGAGFGFAAGVLYGDRYGVDVEVWREREQEREEYEQSEEYAQRMAQANREYKKSDCLKSFDAKITGKKEGYLFAKVCIGSGGHQDNVFHEAHSFGEWAMQHGEEDKLYIILIDTNLMNQLNELMTASAYKAKIAPN